MLLSVDAPLAMSQPSGTSLLLQSQHDALPSQSAKSHSSGNPLVLQSSLVPSAMSWSSGMPLWLQSGGGMAPT